MVPKSEGTRSMVPQCWLWFLMVLPVLPDQRNTGTIKVPPGPQNRPRTFSHLQGERSTIINIPAQQWFSTSGPGTASGPRTPSYMME